MKNSIQGIALQKIPYIFKSLSIYTVIFTFVATPISVFASETNAQKEGSGWNQAAALLHQITSQYQQSQMAKANYAQQASLLQQLKVTPMPSKYFPNCQIAPLTPAPKNICQGISDPNTLKMARFYQQMAERNIDLYKKLERDDQNAKIAPFNNGQQALANSGIACLNQNKSLVESQLQDKLNYLETLASKIKKQNQLFKEQNKTMLDGMKDLNAELNGGGDSIDKNTRDFGKLLGSQCSDIVDSSLLVGANAGLRKITGMMDKAAPGKKSLRSQANFMVKDQSVIKRQLDSQIRSIQNSIDKNGLAGIKLSRSKTTFGPMKDILKEEISVHNANYKQLKDEYAEVTKNYSSVPSLPTDLNRNITQQLSEINPRYLIKNAAIENCISFNGKLDTQQILSSLEHKMTNSRGTTIVRIRDELSKVLGSDSNISNSNYIEKKLEAIKRIDEHYGNGGVTLKLNSSYWGNNASHGYTPYELFSNLYKQCTAQYNAGKIDGANKSKINNVLKRLNDFKAEQRVFSSTLANKLADEILNCPEQDMGQSGQCSQESMQTTSKSFCLKTGVSCAQDVNKCYERAASEIKIREDKIKTFAFQYNKNVEKFVAAQEQYFQQLKGQVAQESGVLKSFFEGANFKVNESAKLFIAMPELATDEKLGVKLRDSKMAFLENLPEAIGTLKKQIQDQSKKISDKIKEHIKGQKDVLKKNIATWEGISKTCNGAEQAYSKMVNEKNKAMADAYKEQEQKVTMFCNKYNALRASPTPICDGDAGASSLMDEAMEISGRLDKDAVSDLNKYRGFCTQLEGDKNTEGDEIEADTPMDVQLCDEDGEGKFNDQKITSYLEDSGIDITELKGIEPDSDEYKALSKNEQLLVRKLKNFGDFQEYCNNLRGRYVDALCAGSKGKAKTDCQDSPDKDVKEYIEGMKAKDSEGVKLLKLVRVVKRLKNKSGNSEWASLGEQSASDCTANNSIQNGFKQATNDIMALQRGMMNSSLGQ